MPRRLVDSETNVLYTGPAAFRTGMESGLVKRLALVAEAGSRRNGLSKRRMRRYDAGKMRSQEAGVMKTKEDDNDASLVVGTKRGICPARLSRLGTGKRAANPVRIRAEFPQAAG
jgi:hypothetical protein